MRCCRICTSCLLAATLGSSEAIARCVEQGLGISCLSRVLVQSQLQARALEILPTTLPRMWRNFSLVQRAGKRRSPALQAFVDACKAGEPSTAQAPNTL